MIPTKRRLLALAALLLIPVWLIACGPPSGGAAAGTTGRLQVLVAGLPDGVDAAVTLSGPNGFGRLLVASATLDDLPAGDYEAVAADVTAGEVYRASVTGSPAAVTPGATATVEVAYAADPAPTGPSIDAVAIEGNGGSSQVRQGRSVTLEVSGSELGGVTLAKLGDVTGFVSANNAISAVVHVTVPHGQPPGPLELTLTADAGVATLADALTVTAITAGPEGSDDEGAGTPDAPFRSLSHAVDHAWPGDTVELLAGSYDEAGGEAWPVTIEDITLRGAGAEETVLQGTDGSIGLRLTGTTSVSDLSVTGFLTGIRPSSGSSTLNRVAASGNQLDGLAINFIGSAVDELRIDDSSFAGNGRHGLVLSSGQNHGPATFVLSGVGSSGNGDRGIYVLHDSDVTIEDGTVGGNETGIEVIHGARLAMRATTVREHALDGVVASGDSELRLDDAEVHSNFGNGVDASGALLEMRSSRVLNNLGDGVRLAGSVAADLGSEIEPGGNRIGVEGPILVGGDFLADDRTADSAPRVLAVGVDLGLEPPPSGLMTGPAASNSPYWRISQSGNQIDFGP